MANTIYKYRVPLLDVAAIEMPKGARVVSAGVQGGSIYLWAIVDQFADLEKRLFRLYGTGHPLSGKHVDATGYIGTVQIDQYVWHVFED